jgi:hypothetical protein
MLRIVTHTVAFMGLIGMAIGIMGEPTWMICVLPRKRCAARGIGPVAKR